MEVLVTQTAEATVNCNETSYLMIKQSKERKTGRVKTQTWQSMQAMNKVSKLVAFSNLVYKILADDAHGMLQHLNLV